MEMRLEDFISQSLRQIIDAVIKTQEYAQSVGAKVNPSIEPRSEKSDNYFRDSNYKYGQFIDFDVAVTASKEKSEKEGIGVSVISIGLGKKWHKSSAEANTSRIKFSIPVVFPIQDS